MFRNRLLALLLAVCCIAGLSCGAAFLIETLQSILLADRKQQNSCHHYKQRYTRTSQTAREHPCQKRLTISIKLSYEAVTTMRKHYKKTGKHSQQIHPAYISLFFTIHYLKN